jgi:hypothetical protein
MDAGEAWYPFTDLRKDFIQGLTCRGRLSFAGLNGEIGGSHVGVAILSPTADDKPNGNRDDQRAQPEAASAKAFDSAHEISFSSHVKICNELPVSKGRITEASASEDVAGRPGRSNVSCRLDPGREKAYRYASDCSAS